MSDAEVRCRRILVVDDDDDIRSTMSDFLADEGYEVVTAADGREALQRLRSDARLPCVILLDLMMPVMTGAQFYAEQQADPALRHVPVCLVSADGNLRARAAAMGCEYLEKPLAVEAIVAVLERHCGAPMVERK